jgi:hypothetical protein
MPSMSQIVSQLISILRKGSEKNRRGGRWNRRDGYIRASSKPKMIGKFDKEFTRALRWPKD